MNYKIDQTNNMLNIDKQAKPSDGGFTTYNKHSASRITNEKYSRSNIINEAIKNANSAFSVSFGDILSDTGMNAYFDGSIDSTNSLSNVLSAKDNHKDYMMVMSSTVSDKELAKIQEEGYDPMDMDPEEIVTIVDEIKATMAKSGVVVSGYNDNLDTAVLEQISGSKAAALELSKNSSILQTNPADDIITQALNNYDLPDTEANREAIKQTADLSMEISPLNDGETKYLLQNNLRPTFENLYLAEHSGSMNSAKNATGYYNTDGFLNKRGSIDDISNLMGDIESVIEDAGFKITDDTRKNAVWMVENGLELTKASFTSMEYIKALPLPSTYEAAANAAAAAIKNTGYVKNAIPGQYKTNEEQALEKIEELDNLIENTPDNIEEDTTSLNVTATPNSFSELSYKRQLEETRLVMTVSNTAFLIKNGINIDFSNLEQLVDNLKTAENVQREILFGRGNVSDNNQAAEIFEFTNKIISEAPALPAASLGISTTTNITLGSFYDEASHKKAQYSLLNERYEPLMTEVRHDLGDSLDKAFENVKSLLNANGIDANAANEKAARILGYNELAITQENIDKIRSADEKLERVVGKMSPSATLSLIREGINPITMDLDELESKLNERQNPSENEIERYSRFLVKLEASKEITDEEKDSYIGIYRTIHQAMKHDSASIGALIQQGGEMTLGNLLTQVRNKKASGKTYDIDDKFGFLDKVITKGDSITDQIEKAFDIDSKKVATTDNKSEITNTPTPQPVNPDVREMLNDAGKTSSIVDQLLQVGHIAPKIKNINGAKSLVEDRAILLRASNEALETTSEENDSQDSEDFYRALNNLHDNFTDVDSAKKAYENLADKMTSLLNNSVYNVEDHFIMKDIRAAVNALGVARNLAKNEHYEIPMEIGGEAGSVTVHLVNGNASSNVSIYTETESFGRISASFTYGENGLEGMITSDTYSTVTMLNGRITELSRSLESKGIHINTINVLENRNTGIKNYSQSDSSDSETYKLSGKQLYETAKSFLAVLR